MYRAGAGRLAVPRYSGRPLRRVVDLRDPRGREEARFRASADQYRLPTLPARQGHQHRAHRIGNQPPQAKACTLQMYHIGSGSVRKVVQISARLVTSGLFVSVIGPRASASLPSSSRTRSSTEKMVMAWEVTRNRLAKTERILTCESPRKPNLDTRSTLPIQKPRMAVHHE